MARSLDLSPLDDLFAKGEDFDLTDAQYEGKIGKPLPKDKDYIKRRSPLARKAKENGFVIASVVDKPVIARTVSLKRIDKEQQKRNV